MAGVPRRRHGATLAWRWQRNLLSGAGWHVDCGAGELRRHIFNRAANAVLECAILLTRLHMLPRDKIEREIAYLAIAIEKTAGPQEREAWSWLMQKREAFYAEN